MSPTSSTVVQAAGALVWRVRQSRLQVALVHRPRYKDWSWPKGKLDPGEASVTAAWREVAEEIGHDVVLGMPLPSLSYKLPDGGTKRVRFWAAQVAGRPEAAALRARPPVRPATRDEIDQARWFDVDAAAHRLTRSSDRAPLNALLDAHAHGRLDTRALVVVRHAAAHKRAQWEGTEADRPLTSAGRAQASALVPMLSAFGVTRVVTSEWQRCTATVAPYAQAAGVAAALVPGLTESAHEDHPARVAALVAELVDAGEDAALCTHRPVLPTVLDVVAQHSRREVADALPRQDPFLKTAEILVTHVAATPAGPRVVAAEQHRPPRS
ncbi:MAG TPA: NUDIX hydrolase [Cellulomonas sp.]